MVAAEAASRVLIAHQPVLVELTKDGPRPRGAALAALLPGCPGPALVDLALSAADAAQLAYGLALRAYRPLSKYRAPADDDPLPMPDRVMVLTDDPTVAQSLFDRLLPVAAGVHLARDLVAEPGNQLGPAELAAQAQALERLGVSVELLDPTVHGLNLLAAVGQGSTRAPLLAVLRWQGSAAEEKPLVLVGKGLTFDSGGLSIKPSEHMEEMKGDMGGAAAVLGAMRAIAGRKAKANVVGVLAIAENMPGGGALRPGDVIRSYKGLTVEVVDTDAEGRLVLADALAWACDHLGPALLVDAATLTGAVVRVLGRHHAGLYANRDTLAARLLKLGVAEAEPLWRLPLSARCDDDFRSDVADWKNCGWGPVPDNDDAARFLQHFVDAKVPWAHLDIAGTSEADEDQLYGPKGATGFGVRLFDALAGG
ncbi:leucyl aminopeptidase family protein [Magnetospirillum gryphiswaldense]|uniref:Leucyl aminopeptidase n=1 Tax=Magnetospirillum gryphiswaldense TaxID=55518 RepID=A4U221_9PROT|nr:leucyl aminopeptidase family protein [Magnetospirillum gryphiswaldense]AVM74897.1 Cytosol aminopeptidase [Magnetospirillum gryphiswaldense MSR-1]AVM78800.1 Cytosol aminopeptidase [Magnetospirillum gryphiswaldense]CAM76928.1 Leucyl aminopeptidase [Magnetospirillum gryphiswaldense MSR-1]